MNDTTIDPQKDAQATEEMLAMLDALEEEVADDGIASPSEEANAETTEVETEMAAPSAAETPEEIPAAVEAEEEAAEAQHELRVEIEESVESAEQLPSEAPEINETVDDTDSAAGEPSNDMTGHESEAAALAENDELETLVPEETPSMAAVEPAPERETVPSEPIEETSATAEAIEDDNNLPQQAVAALEAATEIKQEAEALAHEVAELEQETAAAAVTATEALQDETAHTQDTLESTLAAAERAFSLLKERGITPAAADLGGMDADTLVRKLSQLQARNQALRERNEAIKARLAALK